MPEVGIAAPLGLWSAPRSMSTAFFRMMAERDEFCLVHEPFSELAAGRQAKVGDRQLGTAADLIEFLLSGPRQSFFKDTTEYRHAQLFEDHPALLDMTHTFLIRDPRRVIESHFAMNPEVTRDEIGFEHLYEIFDLVHRHAGRPPVVIDADLLVRDPGGVVAAYCRQVGLAERPDALTWSPGERPEWQATDKWHQDAAASATFRASERTYEVTTKNNAKLAGYLEYHLPFYQQLRGFSLTTAGSSR